MTDLLSKAPRWQLFIDGASRNNPGPSGAGIYILKNNKVVDKQAFFLETKTNNQAEYLALVLGLLCVARDMKTTEHLEVISDSELLIKQMKGEYRVKNANIIPLHTMARTLLKLYPHHTFIHTLRHNNKNADALANKAVDDKIPVPHHFVTFLESHEIYI